MLSWFSAYLSFDPCSDTLFHSLFGSKLSDDFGCISTIALGNYAVSSLPFHYLFFVFRGNWYKGVFSFTLVNGEVKIKKETSCSKVWNAMELTAWDLEWTWSVGQFVSYIFMLFSLNRCLAMPYFLWIIKVIPSLLEIFSFFFFGRPLTGKAPGTFQKWECLWN